MKLQYLKNLLIYVLLLVIVGFVVMVNSYFSSSPIAIFLIINATIFLPGIILSRIVRIKLSGILNQIIFYLTYGFIFNILLCLIAVIFGLTIIAFVKIYFIANILIFLVAFFYELLKPYETLDFNLYFNFKNWWKPINLIYVVLVLIVIMVMTAVDQLGTNLRGDPLYHMSIMRKAIEGLPMTVQNLSYLKNDFPIAYVVPVWHIYLTLLVKITHTNIFTLYREVSTSLVPLVFLVWYFFLNRIFQNRWLVFLALALGMFSFYGLNGYLYTRLAVPDTFANLILLPLAFALALNYIYEKNATYKYLIILSLMVALMGATHWLQFFYYMIGMGFFSVLYLIFNFHENNLWFTFRKILLSIFTNLILVIPILLYWFFISHNTISQNFNMFETVQRQSKNDRFNEFGPYMQLAYVLLPLVGLFLRKNRIFIFLFALFLIGPLVFNLPGVYALLRHYLSHLFVNRFYSNLGEQPFIIWALLIGFILILIDRLLIKLKLNRIIFFGLNITFLLFLIYLIYLEFRFDKIHFYFNQFFNSEKLHIWLNNNYLWLIPVIATIVLTVFIVQKYSPKMTNYFTLNNIQNKGTILLLSLIIILFFASPSLDHLSANIKNEINNRHFLSNATDPTNKIIDPGLFGGWETIDFIRQNIPSKSVIDTNTRANYTLPTLLDIHMASWTNNDDVDPAKLYSDLYKDIPIEDKLNLLSKGDIDYLIFVSKLKKNSFDDYPQYFEKLFDNGKSIIYRIDKKQIKLGL